MDEKAAEFIGDDLPSGLMYPGNDEAKEDFEMTRDELNQIKQAMKSEKFRNMLDEYAEEVQDPKNRTTFQTELRQLEKQNGNVVHFINPIAGFVLKTSVNGDKKAFINVCSNPMIRRMSFEQSTQDNVDGTMCSIPFAQSPMREDLDKAGQFCSVYDVVFHPETLRLSIANTKMRDQLETTALEAVEKSFNVNLDKNNVRRPKLRYKGMKHATMIKYKIGGQPPEVLDPEQLNNETPPQPQEPYYNKKDRKSNSSSSSSTSKSKPPGVETKSGNASRTTSDNNVEKENKAKITKPIEWTEPKYSLKYRSHVDLQNFCFDNQREGRSVKSIPEEIILTVDLPLLKDSSTLEADVVEGGWDFELKAERKAHYLLNLKLPFEVHCDKSKASFDVDKRKLVVVMKTVQKFNKMSLFASSSDSGNESATANSDEAHSSSLESLTTSISPDIHDDLDDVRDDKLADVQNTKTKTKCVRLIAEAKSQSLDEPASNATQAISVPVKVPTWKNGDVVFKSILKNSPRCRSVSESCLGLHERLSSYDEDYISMESLYYDEEPKLGESPSQEKSVRFSDSIQRQLYRSNSSILGQKKKNQRKSQNKRKARERLNSGGSISSVDDGHDRDCFSSLPDDDEYGNGDGDGNERRGMTAATPNKNNCDNGED